MSGGFQILIATEEHTVFAGAICEEMAASALQRGTGIARRSPELIVQKIREGKAVIALSPEGHWAGFCYVESWDEDRFVSNSGLIVVPAYRQHGLARGIKQKIFELSRMRFPQAKVFGLTTSAAVMKINSEMGYEPVIYSEIPQEEKFWEGCKSCVNHAILESKGRKNCLCTAMLYDPLAQLKALIQTSAFSYTAS